MPENNPAEKIYSQESTEEKSGNASFTVHDLPKSERPRERLIELGADSLSSVELLAVILGRGIKGESVMTTAQKLLTKFGSLNAILEASFEELTSVKGIGTAKACQLIALFSIAKKYHRDKIEKEKLRLDKDGITCPEDAIELLKNSLPSDNKEYFYVLSFDVRNRLIGYDRISEGSLSASVVHPRETFESAIKKHAARIIVAHNHPSGDTSPSKEDINITKRLFDAGKILGIELIDHIIFSKTSYFSFKEKNMI